MSQAKTREYRKEIAFWQKILGLSHFEIGFEETDEAGVREHGGGKVTVACYAADGLRRKATIYFNRENPDNDGLSHVVAHETIHICGDHFIHQIDRLIDLIPEGPGRDLMFKQFCDEWEIFVDDIARGMLRLKAMGERKLKG